METNKYKVSIIVPLFNVETYIKSCLQSVIDQSCEEEIECIIVDDCGNDNSLSIVEDFVTNYCGNVSFKLLHHKENKGLSASRNTGILASTGDYLYFLDSDDTLANDCIYKMLEVAKVSNCDFVYAQHMCIDENYDVVSKNSIQKNEGLITDRSSIISSYHTIWNVSAWNKLVSRNYLIKNNLFFEEGIIREDELWSFKLACTAQSMYFLRASTYNHLVNRSGSIMNNGKLDYHIKSLKKVIEKEVNIVLEQRLQDSMHLYNIIEDAKRRNLSSAHWIYDKSALISDYRFYRKLKYKSVFSFPLNSLKSVFYIIRDFHYVLPVDLGFYWLTCLNYLVLRKNLLIKKMKQ